MRKILVTLAVATAPPASADTSVMVETDPATFVLSGFAAHVRVVPGRTHVVVGAGVYALDYPKVIVETSSMNDGFSVRLRFGAAAFIDYSFAGNADGWFVGGELAAQSFRYTAMDDSATATNLVVMPRAGYQWRPFGNGFYLMPWLGVGYTAQISGHRVVAGRSYDLLPVVPYAAVHVGWRF